MNRDKTWYMNPNVEKALYLAQRDIPVLVYDAINLEGINFTLPEVQTLLEGITVGGHKVSDQEIVLNQNNTWLELIKLIKNNIFTLNKETVCYLHKIAGYNDALCWGNFRDKQVTIAGTQYLPPKANELPYLFNNMVKKAKQIEDIYDKAIYVFLEMARNQFFYDINKRMGRFMMNGILLQAGYPIINVEATKKLEFNKLMLEFYTSNNQSSINNFLRGCLKKEHILFMEGKIE